MFFISFFTWLFPSVCHGLSRHNGKCEKCHMTSIKGDSNLNVLYEYIKKLYLTDVKFPAWTFNSGKSLYFWSYSPVSLFACICCISEHVLFFLSLHYSFCLHAMVWGATMVNMVRKIIGQHEKNLYWIVLNHKMIFLLVFKNSGTIFLNTFFCFILCMRLSN